MAGSDDDIPPPPPQTQTPTQQAPHIVSTIKLPIIKKGEYNGVIKVLPPKTAEEILARERERKARTTLLMALPEDHLAKFHKMTDAKEMWEAIKTRFCGNDESKKMQKYILKQQFEGFSISNSEGLHKGYDISSGHNPQREGSSSYADELTYFFFANQSSGPKLDYEDLEQLDEQGILPESADPRGIKIVGGEMLGTLGIKLKINERRSGKMEEPKALVTLDGDGVDWTSHSEDEQENYALMAYSNSGSDTEMSARDKAGLGSSDFNSCESNSSEETNESVPKPVANEPKAVSDPKVWSDAPIIEEYESDSDDEHKGKGTGQGENRPVWNNVKRVNHQNQFVPTAVLTRTGRIPVNTARASTTNNVNTARHNFNSQAVPTNAARKVNTVKPIVNNVRSKTVFHKTHSPIRRPFKRTTAPKTNLANQKVNIAGDKVVSGVGGIGKTNVKPSADYVWRLKRNYVNKFSKCNGGSNSRKFYYPQKALKNKGIVDSGCSRHMTGNKAHLAKYQDYNGRPVAFGGSKGYITGKGKIKTGKLDFKDVCFVKELQH
ncbi:hypothetical protein Tco_0838711 [Tanacetum coccineum]|uniref:Retrovirus-related Pol polyprotein from transposon TNT 1-94-like beta-barrel domain-containing protein n=1 Tax=Tanacetum coccineum TaxID=301880 RepID=A0ABQ5AQD2_9ASTR